ncbi:MAG: hypothetical protein AAB822_02440 [Patescibacteria group bacterium]
MKKRILADIFLFGLFFWMPWYVTATFAVIFMLFFENYWEGAIIAFIADAFYSLPGAKFFAGGFGFFTLSSLFVLYLSSFVKSKIKIL